MKFIFRLCRKKTFDIACIPHIVFTFEGLMFRTLQIALVLLKNDVLLALSLKAVKKT